MASNAPFASTNVKNAASVFISFLNRSVTPFHVESCENILQKAGFKEVLEGDDFQVGPGDKCFIKKNCSSIFAFAVGGQYKPGNGFSLVATHTDSPCLRVKPISKKVSEKFLQVAISPYGGGLWRTWFDRDLSVAGQVIFQRGQCIHHTLIDVGRPVLFIPNLAIHLEKDRNKFELNTEVHLTTLFASQLNINANGNGKEKKDQQSGCMLEEHHAEFLKLIAEHANCKPEEILDMDLYLYDTQPAAITGLNEEFISGARLDNLVGTYTAINGLVESLNDEGAFKNDPNIRLVACFDNEEVGSGSAQGAESAFTEWLLRRLACNAKEQDGTAFERAIAKSYMISADQAHACHPNYGSCHEDNHRPRFHGGVVVKVNANQRYATTAMTHAILKTIAERAKIPLQKVVVRNDSPCGSTVGPILSAKLGLQTIDIGSPQLAMHSIREFADVTSIWQQSSLCSSFFQHLPAVLDSIQKRSEQ